MLDIAHSCRKPQKMNLIVSTMTFYLVKLNIQILFDKVADGFCYKFLLFLVFAGDKSIVCIAIIFATDFLAALYIPLNPFIFMTFVISCIGCIVFVRFKCLFNEVIQFGKIAISQQRTEYRTLT